MARVLFHIDLNAFYASCEEVKNPSLRGKPIAVGSLSKRGVLSTANYKAREYGVHSAMPVYEAQRLCPELIIVQGDYQYYRSISAQFFDYLRSITPLVEQMSIDEGYLDVTEVIARYPRPLDLAFQIQDGIFEKLGLSCSIGVAPTRFLAKMASDMKKPRGITVLRKAEIPTKLYPLPISDIVGLGKKSVELLKKYNIVRIEDFASTSNEDLIIKLLGKNGYRLIQSVRGKSSDQLHVSTSRKSLSQSRTYETDLYTLDEILVEARKLTTSLVNTMQRENVVGKLASISLRDTDFHTIERSLNLSNYTNRFDVLYSAFSMLFEEHFESIGYRHIGVGVGSIKGHEQVNIQASLFDVVIPDTDSIVNNLNRKLDAKVFMKASDLLHKENKNG